MTTLIPVLRRLRWGAVVSTLSAIVLLTSGCATQRQSSELVAETNTALAQFPDIQLQADPSAGLSGGGDWQSTSRKMDAFIAAHPDQPVTIGALRIRQGVLLLSNRQYDLAQAAFNSASNLKTDRDKALKALSPSLIWWYQHSADASLDPLQRAKAREALAAFDEQIAKVQGSPDLRDFLAEMRARIGLKLASEEQGDAKRATFIETINRYSEIFTADDIQALAQGNLRPGSNAVTVTERRRLRAVAVIAKAKKMTASGSLASLTASNFENPQFAKLVVKS